MSFFRELPIELKAIQGTSTLKQADLQSIKTMLDGNSSGAQCERLLTALARYRVTTFEAMRYLDVYCCPARVFQLRKCGYKITTHWEMVITESGGKHIVGSYALDRTACQLNLLSPMPPKKPTQLALQFESELIYLDHKPKS
jgi:Helix-turn-helix domain